MASHPRAKIVGSSYTPFPGSEIVLDLYWPYLVQGVTLTADGKSLLLTRPRIASG